MNKINLAGQALTAYSKNGTLPSRLEVHRARLERVMRVVNLLGEIKRVVHTSRSGTWLHARAWRRGGENCAGQR